MLQMIIQNIKSDEGKDFQSKIILSEDGEILSKQDDGGRLDFSPLKTQLGKVLNIIYLSVEGGKIRFEGSEFNMIESYYDDDPLNNKINLVK